MRIGNVRRQEWDINALTIPRDDASVVSVVYVSRAARITAPPTATRSYHSLMSLRPVLIVATLVLTSQLSACAPRTASPGATSATIVALASAQQDFWQSLQSLCGRAFAGRLTESNAGDSLFVRSTVIMHVRECTPKEVRVPLHVGDDRSRTWVITPVGGGLRLKHDHRHRDGSEDPITQYGGDTHEPGTGSRQEFHADSLTAALIPAARTNIWTVEILPGVAFAYGLRREGTDRRFRVEFDLTRPVAPPPPPWGRP